ncbi:CDP-glycerol glycerophosphotransferase family protein [Sporomusa sphaeroides]|uniref:CDP-glycerol glycerophosphotransferase family protein n=1 Tax=Sporomusa sphaeroides TaxID=47679 RepID=UPI002D189F49|nr:CDP-glycerol glycerophosphotransferase family protein [Sporomusa sphaeroides]HML34227.1 CDP-glycerol glycerophosphotransferase family protein [Sporomusa sphaeroides]
MNHELETYKQQIKSSITEEINQNRLPEARWLLKEYESIVPDDVEIYSIKAVIEMLDNQLDEAKRIILEGLDKAPDNFDLLYNRAYLAELNTELVQSVRYYRHALKATRDENLKDEITSKMNELKQKMFAQNYRRFILLSSCPWNIMLQRPHQMATALSRQSGVTGVDFVQPPTRADVTHASITMTEALKFSHKNQALKGNVTVHMPVKCYHSDTFVLDNTLSLVQALVDEAIEEIVFICYFPAHAELLKKLKGDFRIVYDCVDDHTDLDYSYWSQRDDRAWEQELADQAEIILTTSCSLYLTKAIMENRANVYLSKNAVAGKDVNFTGDLPCPPELKAVPSPRVCYMGAVDKWFNEELFYTLVRKNRDKAFVVIGPVREGLLTQKEPNLYLLGVVEHSQLKNYLHHMDVGIIPFKDNIDLIVNCDPIKMYEYLACGLPVVATNMPELVLGKDYIKTCGDFTGFNKAIHDFCCVKQNKEEMTAFVRNNVWEQRTGQLADILNGEQESYSRRYTLSRLQAQWEVILEQSDNPILLSMYAVSLSKQDIQEFQKLAETAYTKLPIKYNLRNYVNSLVLNGQLEQAIQVVLTDKNVKERYKAELVYALANGKEQVKPLKVMYCIDNYFEIRRLLIEIKDHENAVETANYYFETGKYQEAFDAYKSFYGRYLKVPNTENLLEMPLATFNYGTLFQMAQEQDRSHEILKKYEALVKQYLSGSVLGRNKPTSKKLSRDKQEFNFVSDLFDKGSQDFVQLLVSNGIPIHGCCSLKLSRENKIALNQVRDIQSRDTIKIIIPYDEKYVEQVRLLADNGILECYVAAVNNSKPILIHIDKELMKKIRDKEYLTTITFSKYNAADSNIHALLTHAPEEYRLKYKFNVIYGKDVWSLDNMVKVPLKSSVTVSGFATFLYYPKFTYNIEVGHGGLQLKACGLMDKKDKNSGGNPGLFEKADCVCVASHLNMVVFSSFYAIPENKYEITGLPRNDMLYSPASRSNLEKLLDVDLTDKKIIFNMPTFHIVDQIGRVEGSTQLNDSFKIVDFGYGKFNEFLVKNNMICVSKVHHGEELSVSKKTKDRAYSNLFFINNDDLEKSSLDLYEVLGAGDILITDYSTVYNDFLFMNKHVIFVNADIEDYRRERGIILEPYDFWTAGPKVNTQDELQSEIVKCLSDLNYFRTEREKLLPVFFQTPDTNSVKRTWNVIDKAVKSIMLKEETTK